MATTKDFKTRTCLYEREFPCPAGKWLIGLDIGYSAVKGISPNKVFCFPAYAKKVPADRLVLKESSDTDIRYRDRTNGTWVVGSLAYDEVDASEIPESDSELYSRYRYFSTMFLILARVGIAMALMSNQYGDPSKMPESPDKIQIQTGLPPRYLEGDTADIKEAISGFHEFELKVGKRKWTRFTFSLNTGNIHVMSQPLGAFISAAKDTEGKWIKDAKALFEKNVIVFDPGFGTTDEYIVKRGTVVDSQTFSEYGMHEVFARTCRDINAAFGLSLSVPELQNYLDSGEVRVVNRKEMTRRPYSFENILLDKSREVMTEMIEKMKSIHNYFADVDYIICTGGTYDAWAQPFNAVFRNMEGLAIIPGNTNDPSLSNIFTNVRGYYFTLFQSAM
uniref:ParM/StbA family protein n=1 Tax=Lachnoclostridium phocaeense TaxID=1871021 RepID=UPI0026DCFF9F|nr:ParM/StbA family protein [Lachnoclostridium phocaeense]